MKKLLSIFCGTAFVLMITPTNVFACSCCGKKAEAAQSTSSCQNSCSAGCGNADATCSEKALEVKNTNCPVSGQPIGSMGDGVSVTHNGKTYQLCCAGCVERFKAYPEQYIQKMETGG